MVAAAAAMLLGGAAMSSVMQKANPAMPAGFMSGIGFFYVLMAFLYIYPTLKIWKFGTAIGKLVQSGSSADLENALDQQRRFWKFIGIMMIIMLVVYLVFFVVVIGIAATAAAAGGLPK